MTWTSSLQNEEAGLPQSKEGLGLKQGRRGEEVEGSEKLPEVGMGYFPSRCSLAQEGTTGALGKPPGAAC